MQNKTTVRLPILIAMLLGTILIYFLWKDFEQGKFYSISLVCSIIILNGVPFCWKTWRVFSVVSLAVSVSLYSYIARLESTQGNTSIVLTTGVVTLILLPFLWWFWSKQHDHIITQLNQKDDR